MRKYFAIVIIICPCYFSVAQSKEGVKVTDMLQIKSVSSITLTDDGSKAAFTVLSIEPDTAKWEYKYVTQIWTAGADGSQLRQLTFAKEGASQPRWSHNGKQLAFVRTLDGKPQIFLIRFDGGEAMQLTKHKYGASNPEWSKDDKRILFTAQISLRDLLTDSMLNPNKDLPKWSFEKPGFI